MATKPSPADRYQLKVTLRDTDPPIWRQFLIDPAATLGELHVILQIVMGWQNYHMHEFVKGPQRYTHAEALDHGDQDERQVKLSDVLTRVAMKMTYIYDFGDGWEHDIVLEKRVAAEPGQPDPLVLAGERKCPPEDCGGVWGYYALLEALADRKHPEHYDRKEWLGRKFDPEEFSVTKVNKTLHRGSSKPKK